MVKELRRLPFRQKIMVFLLLVVATTFAIVLMIGVAVTGAWQSDPGMQLGMILAPGGGAGGSFPSEPTNVIAGSDGILLAGSGGTYLAGSDQ